MAIESPPLVKTAKVSEKGWVVIPKEMRDRLGLKKGAEVRLVQIGEQIVLTAEPEDRFAKGWGMLTGGMTMKEYLEEKRRELEEEERGLPPPRPLNDLE